MTKNKKQNKEQKKEKKTILEKQMTSVFFFPNFKPASFLFFSFNLMSILGPERSI
jgi:hypothetical protein